MRINYLQFVTFLPFFIKKSILANSFLTEKPYFCNRKLRTNILKPIKEEYEKD